jgi:hypothetical protein
MLGHVADMIGKGSSLPENSQNRDKEFHIREEASQTSLEVFKPK